MKLLIASPNEDLSSKLPKVATENGYLLDIVTNGKDCQMRLYKGDYSIVILDLDIANHSSFEVLKYIKLNHLSVKVLLYVESKKKFEELNLSEKDLNKMGVSQTFISTSSLASIFKSLKEFNYATKWKDLKPDNSPRSEGVMTLPDNQFTRVKSIDFMGGNLSVFDLYLRLGENRYIKILNMGEGLNPERLMKYANNGVEFFYFLTTERSVYINYMNELSKKMTTNLSTERAKVVIKSMSSVSDQFIEEVYTKGIQPQLVLEAKGICDNMYSLIKSDKALNHSMDEYTSLNPDSFSHIFLNAFFSMIICKNLIWVGTKTRDAIAMASLLHDIGMLKVPASIREKDPLEMSASELVIYKKHPEYGYEMLQKSNLVSEQVKQVVLQHHECVSGKGFPYGLNGISIYPLAKIAALADSFSNLIKKEKITPKVGIKVFLQDRERIMDYDPLVIKALIQGFIKG
jgi:HD-GYP domain-containing protein (c-di-GMP phosphodiesterase class II)